MAAILAETSSPLMYGTSRRRTSSDPRAPRAERIANRSLEEPAFSSSFTTSGRKSSVTTWASGRQVSREAMQLACSSSAATARAVALNAVDVEASPHLATLFGAVQ